MQCSAVKYTTSIQALDEQNMGQTERAKKKGLKIYAENVRR